ncbi:hypothetical protein CONLIGDRAFT_399810 [Coniochaeta ligniaria NRRL 30616]|uniref:Uncharacterized protein n=1 Tax=Coniochaeta ligniaria NRRL 30616 TaxID=1408157 RepID=A0A1J7IMW9_9PEZI|nr:hypothetical protein CONLIGDRAFT_399810 [Coniochaeta ligniaria NRRL 30616]
MFLPSGVSTTTNLEPPRRVVVCLFSSLVAGCLHLGHICCDSLYIFPTLYSPFLSYNRFQKGLIQSSLSLFKPLQAPGFPDCDIAQPQYRSARVDTKHLCLTLMPRSAVVFVCLPSRCRGVATAHSVQPSANTITRVLKHLVEVGCEKPADVRQCCGWDKGTQVPSTCI